MRLLGSFLVLQSIYLLKSRRPGNVVVQAAAPSRLPRLNSPAVAALAAAAGISTISVSNQMVRSVLDKVLVEALDSWCPLNLCRVSS